MERFEGRTVLITGGASGIGAATAQRLAAEGARVALADTQLEKAQQLAADLEGFAVAMDVADIKSVNAGVAEAVEAIGPIDVLVNNAGTDLFGFFVNTTPEMWEVVIGINLIGTMAVTVSYTHLTLPTKRIV